MGFEKKILLAICLLSIAHAVLSQTADERCEMETDGTWIQNYEYCERYYLCKDGIAAPGECLDERWFNPTTQSCDLPFSFRCTSANSPNPPAPEPEPEPELDACPERGIAKLKHPYSCQKYIICVEGYEFDRDCPVGQHFNAADGECVPASESDCAINEERCSPTADVAPFFITDTRDCTSYYLCMRNAWLELTCAPGFFFDVHNRWCQVPEEVECVPSVDHDHELPNGDLEFDCADVRGVFFHPHPSSCYHYFICMNGVSTLRFCARGLEYDASRESCNYPQFAGCDRHSVAPA